MNKKLIITTFLIIFTLTGWAQKHLPAFQYSKEPAILNGTVIGKTSQKPNSVRIHYLLKFTSGMGDAFRQKSVAVDANGHFSLSLPIFTPTDCHVTLGSCSFTCYVVPGQTVSFTLNLDKLESQGLSRALAFSGQLADFNHDSVYATDNVG